MIQYGIVTISMVGGTLPYGISGSGLVAVNPIMLLRPDPNKIASGQQYISSGMGLKPQANVIHSGEVSINDPMNP